MRKHSSLILSIFLTVMLSACQSTNVSDTQVIQQRSDTPPPSGYTRQTSAPLVHLDTKRAHQGVQHFAIPADFGNIAMSWASYGAGGRGPLLLMCMGATENRDRSNSYYVQRAIESGDVITFDYPGYGQSGGKATTAHFEMAADTLTNFIDMEAARSGRSVVVWGHSMGGFVCSEIARRSQSVDAVIIETSAQNVDRVVTKGVPFFARPLAAVFVNDAMRGYDIAKSLLGFSGPVLVLGAEQDLILNVKLSRELAHALSVQGNQVRYVEFPQVGHTDLFKGAGFRELIWTFLSNFR